MVDLRKVRLADLVTSATALQVKSGMLVAPGIPMPIELQEMQEIVGTFGGCPIQKS